MKTTGAAPSRSKSNELDWKPLPDDLKYYPHFDAPLKLSEIRQITNDPDRVAKNAFFPLIQYEKKWQPFRKPKTGSKPKPKPEAKSRKIRYASRRDAYIYARYRRILSPLYEMHILQNDIAEVPIAYRKIKSHNNRGKCNIDFAKDAFDFIMSCERCFVISLDISKFFESLDLGKIEQTWKDLLSVTVLPPDHAAVFNSLTDYRWVDRTEAYKRLGYFGAKVAKNGSAVNGYLTPFADMPKQLCNPSDFREKIAGGGKNLPSIIKKNKNKYGIPQGTPISDLIANMYMMQFDKFIKSIADCHEGKAFRYSDDIMLIVKVETRQEAEAIEKEIRDKMPSFGNELLIKESKSSIHQFSPAQEGSLTCQHIKGSGINGLEYLGFRFDGKRVFLRDSTISNLKRKLTFVIRIRCSAHKKRYPNKNTLQLINSFNFDNLFQTFMRVEDFDSSMTVKNWTFWTYAHRATNTFGNIGRSIPKQLKHLKPDGRRLVENELT